jgi:hypothetical protein
MEFQERYTPSAGHSASRNEHSQIQQQKNGIFASSALPSNQQDCVTGCKLEVTVK